MLKILFVCLGNICRSPLAEAMFREKVENKGLSGHITCDSAGTGNYHVGEDPDERSIEIARKYNFPMIHKGRQLLAPDGKAFDYILAMDTSNHRNILRILNEQHAGLYLLGDFDPLEKGGEVPDPYFGGLDGFEDVYEILDRTLDHFLEFLIERHQLKHV